MSEDVKVAGVWQWKTQLRMDLSVQVINFTLEQCIND